MAAIQYYSGATVAPGSGSTTVTLFTAPGTAGNAASATQNLNLAALEIFSSSSTSLTVQISVGGVVVANVPVSSSAPYTRNPDNPPIVATAGQVIALIVPSATTTTITCNAAAVASASN